MKRITAERFLKNKYNHLLWALILLFLLSPSLEARDRSMNFPIAPLLLLVVLIAAMRADFPKGTFYRVFWGFAVVSFALNMLIYFLPEAYESVIDVLKIVSGSISVLFYATAAFCLTGRLFSVRVVTADTIKGGISAYLMLGFIWAGLYALLTQFCPDTFIISSGRTIEDMMYVHFSFTTLTTLGYGDIVPNGRIAALLTNSEAIIGQLYLTIFVARLVGLYIVSENKPQIERNER